MKQIRILVVEDNRDIIENIADFMEARDYVLDYAMDGLSGLHLALTGEFDVIVLDVMLPGMNGVTLCRTLRKEAGKSTPVIMLTARDTLEDKLTGFDSGADDYLVKPFALQELEARIRALTKRKTSDKKSLQMGGLSLDTGTLAVTRNGMAIDLNNTCFSILKLLMERAPNVVTRRELEHHLWGEMPPGSDVLRSHLYTLRQKIDKPFDRPLLETVHGVGFRLKEKA